MTTPGAASTEIADVFRKYWGFDAFRPGQREVVEAILAGRHVLGVMPTGAGKSLCYQLPALLLPGVTLVVSPLIALMKDQVDQLRGRGVAAAFLNSSIGLDEQLRVLDDARNGRLKLLYVAPERFRYEGALARLKRLPVSLFAVDEAHCISHWGHDFRPEYQSLGAAFREMGTPRLGAFTATATSQVRRDIVDSLAMQDPMVTVAGFARDNLHLSVAPIQKMNEKPRLAAKLVKGALASGGVAVVYCATRANCEKAADALGKAGIRVVVYHGGLDDASRKSAQEAFQKGDHLVIVATNAFGMGVDKPEVRLVLHWDFPGSLDAYYQEVGRAGRDGQRAYGVMLFTYADQRIHEFFIDKGGEDLPPPARVARAEAERIKLKAITRWAYHEGCRHASLLRYFGDRPKACDLDDPAGSRCDNCTGNLGISEHRRSPVLDEATPEHRRSPVLDEATPEHRRSPVLDEAQRSEAEWSGGRTGHQAPERGHPIGRTGHQAPERGHPIGRTGHQAPERGHQIDHSPSHEPRQLNEAEEVIVQKALSAVARANGGLELKTLAKALRGSRAADVLKGPLAATKSFGILSELPEATTRSLLFALAQAGCCAGTKPRLTALGVEVMWRRESVKLGMPPFASASRRKPAASSDASPTDAAPDDGLIRALKERRMTIAKARGVAAFVIASNALLDRIAGLPPDAPRDQWLALNGIGEQNVEPLREAFAQVLLSGRAE